MLLSLIFVRHHWHHHNIWNNVKTYLQKVSLISKHFTKTQKIVVVFVLKVILSCVRKRLHMCLAAPLGAPLSAACIPRRAVFWDAHKCVRVRIQHGAQCTLFSAFASLSPSLWLCDVGAGQIFSLGFCVLLLCARLGLVKNCAWEPQAPSSHTASKNLS